MNFNELEEYLIGEGCSLEHLGANVYLAKNCINGEVCIVEDLESYSIPTFSHYFYELKVQPPFEYEDYVHVYELFRNKEINPQLKEK